ncbi:unnamed protein product, partial [Durusdinium trenchii]
VGASKAKKQEKATKEVLQRKTFARICEEPNEGDAKLAKSLSEKDLKKVVEKASKGIMTAEQADSVAKKIQTEGVEKLSDELLTQEEEAIEKILQKADKAASLMALEANETLPGSLMELSQANEQQLQGFWFGMTSLLISIIARVIYLATGGAFALFLCLLSFGELSVGVHKEFTMVQQCAGAQLSTRCMSFDPLGMAQVLKKCILVLQKREPDRNCDLLTTESLETVGKLRMCPGHNSCCIWLLRRKRFHFWL